MKFDHKVKYNGKWYMPNEEIAEINTVSAISDNVKEYTKTDIYKMNTAELRKLGFERGIDNAEQLTGTELKKLLLANFDD